jgi:anhydro-N-acetylmuramic acid kinase
VDDALLAALRAEPYLALPPPKSTGRELFNGGWLRQRLNGVQRDPQNVQATLTRFTSRTIGDALSAHAADAADVVVCGGGAFNRTLMSMLAEDCSGRPVRLSADLGIDPSHVEALAFAWLAWAHVEGATGNLPGVTGARGARVLGAHWPR